MYKVTRFDGIDGLLALKPAWALLYESCKHQAFINTWNWHFCFAKYLLKEPVNYYLISKSTIPVAIFPLQRTCLEKGGTKWRGYCLPRHKHLDLADALISSDCEGERVFDFFVKYLRNCGGGKWHLLSLSKFRQRSNLYASIQRTEHRLEVCSSSFHIHCSMSSPFSDSVSRKHLKNVGRLQRKAETMLGKLGLKRVSDYAHLNDAFEQFLSIEASGWKGQSGSCSSINSNPDIEAFYRSLIEEFGPGGQISINFLVAGEECLATQFCIKADNCWHLLKIGYDEKYQEYGPGNILLKLFAEAVSELAEGGEINLVTGPPWAERWRFDTEAVYRTEIYNKTLEARMLTALVWGRMQWGRLVWRKQGKRAAASLKGTIK